TWLVRDPERNRRDPADDHRGLRAPRTIDVPNECWRTGSAVSWVMFRVHVFEAEWADCRYLSDVLARPRPVEVRSAAGEHDDGARRIGLQLVAVEMCAQADVEDAGDDRVDTILRVPVRHQLDAGGQLDSNRVEAWLGRITDHDGEAGRWRERWK